MARTGTYVSMIASLAIAASVTGCAAMLLTVPFGWRTEGWGVLVWLGSYLAMVLVRAPHWARYQAGRVVSRRTDVADSLMLIGMALTMLVLPFLWIVTGLFGWADYRLPGWATALGGALQPPLLWLFWRSHADLGRNWSHALEVRDDHGLVTSGVYVRVRHPMYAALGVFAIAQPLLLPNWIAGFLIVPAFAGLLLVRIPREEAMMRERFGLDYDAYAARTRRILPRCVSGWRPFARRA